MLKVRMQKGRSLAKVVKIHLIIRGSVYFTKYGSTFFTLIAPISGHQGLNPALPGSQASALRNCMFLELHQPHYFRDSQSSPFLNPSSSLAHYGAAAACALSIETADGAAGPHWSCAVHVRDLLQPTAQCFSSGPAVSCTSFKPLFALICSWSLDWCNKSCVLEIPQVSLMLCFNLHTAEWQVILRAAV